MKRIFSRNAGWMVTFILLSCCTSSAQATTPEAALEEMVTTRKPDVFEKHLPLVVQQALDQLPDQDKSEVLGKFFVAKKLEEQQLKLRHSDDEDQWTLVGEDGGVEGIIKLRNTFVSGTDAFVLLQAKEKERPWQQFLVSMRLEENEWRISEIGPWHATNLASEELMREILPVPRNEAAATELLVRLNRALQRYSELYPAVGFPASLQSLGGSPGDEPSPQHAMLVDFSINGNTFTKGGYEFHYLLLDPGQPERPGNYQITAQPVEWGKTGSRSFFIDLSSVIRFTNEARTATESDLPL